MPATGSFRSSARLKATRATRANDRKRKAREPIVSDETQNSSVEEDDAENGRPVAKKARSIAKKAKPPMTKQRNELEDLRKAPVPDVNVDAARRDPPQTHYWLMKSESEVRVEDGYEIKFSIDDLAAKTAPEGWEGIRNYVARNNMRDMRKGDKAFFYHSNCKEPGVVGIMTICKEYSPDWNACINDNPYYDPSAPHDGSKWSLVHVRLEHKFPAMVPLRLLKETGQAKDSTLGNMQLLRQSRLSVTKVTRDEWDEVIRMARELDQDNEWDRTVEESSNQPNYSAA